MMEFRTPAASRTFDPMLDQHPVQWVVDKLKPSTYEPMNDWLHDHAGPRVGLFWERGTK